VTAAEQFRREVPDSHGSSVATHPGEPLRTILEVCD